ncbi:MAG: bifunctional adenosylcobinamide kinase/adenosylcobinamide-phosphate guanylyltransferase [Opitutales bacterium]|nr:bifunctional adenosylcobinamide kinase/adenosylcobinamide-phosphate guanylyltransferase [Opitutales bacterium]
MTHASIDFILGACRSGKSRQAELLARTSGRSVVYVATCRTSGIDHEMEERIKRHRQDRPSEWQTVENSFDLEALARDHRGSTLLIDCLTMWVSHLSEYLGTKEVLGKLGTELQAIRENDIHAIIVSNEVGMGIVPVDADTRRWRDLVGWANQLASRNADNVYWMVAGIPLQVKSNGINSRFLPNP